MPKFQLGQEVSVENKHPRTHIRTPRYVRGKTGVVVAVLGKYRNPEQLAYGGDGLPKLPLYRVSFRQEDLWPDYEGQPQDTAVLEIYEPWLHASK